MKMNRERKYIKEKVFLILIFSISVQCLFGVTLPSNSYISKASVTTNDQSAGGIAQPPSSPLLGDAPALPPDPGEVPIGNDLILVALALSYLIYKSRKNKSEKRISGFQNRIVRIMPFFGLRRKGIIQSYQTFVMKLYQNHDCTNARFYSGRSFI